VVEYGLLLVTALMVSLLAMPIVTTLAHKTGMVDRPDERKVHARPMPKAGGIAIAVGFIFGLSMFAFGDAAIQGVMLGALIIIITGIIDDIWHISPRYKFAGEILAAVAFIWWSGVSLHSLGDLIGTGPIQTGNLASMVTVICIVGVINAVNLSDGLDGLAGGLSAIACLFLGFFAYACHQWAVLSIVVALFGALLGFLYYNSHPAKIFMGDTGSLLLGYLLATTAVLLAEGGDHAIAPISMALVLALPIIDTLLVMTRRMMLGRSPFSPDKTHLHHRLLRLGLPHGAVVSVLYGTMGLFGLAAVYLRHVLEWMQLAGGLGLALLVYGVVSALERAGFQWSGAADAADAADTASQHTLFERLIRWSGRSIPWVTWLIPCTLLAPVFFIQPLPQKLNWLLMLSATGLLALYPIRSPNDRLGLVHGLLYWCVFLLLVVFACYGDDSVHFYLAVLSILVALWVVIKLVFRRARRVFLTSGFEVLLILVSWLVPELLTGASYLDELTRKRLTLACLESIPFLLAMKIVIRRQPRRNYALMLSLLTILLLVALKSYAGLPLE